MSSLCLASSFYTALDGIQAWWLLHVILALRELRQEDCLESQVNLDHIVSSKSAYRAKLVLK